MAKFAKLARAYDKAHDALTAAINRMFRPGQRVRVSEGKRVLRGVVAFETQSYHDHNVSFRTPSRRVHRRHYTYVELDE